MAKISIKPKMRTPFHWLSRRPDPVPIATLVILIWSVLPGCCTKCILGSQLGHMICRYINARFSSGGCICNVFVSLSFEKY